MHNISFFSLCSAYACFPHFVQYVDCKMHCFFSTHKVIALVKYLVSKILGKIQGTEMLADLENLGSR